MTTEQAQKLAGSIFPAVDARISDEQAQFFRENGLLIIRNFLKGAELRVLQEQTGILVQLAEEGLTLPEFAHPDFFYQLHQLTGKCTPFRVKYVIAKTEAGNKQKLLLSCLKHRADSKFGHGETPFVYCPDPEFTAPSLAVGEELPTYRYAHGDHGR